MKAKASHQKASRTVAKKKTKAAPRKHAAKKAVSPKKPAPKKAAVPEKKPLTQSQQLDNALADSFPASDPPSMTEPGQKSDPKAPVEPPPLLEFQEKLTDPTP